MAGLSAAVWFDLAYLALALALLALWVRHRRRPLAVVPASWLGKGQLLYLGLLWTVVVFNFERAIVAFAAQRLVTEGVLYLVALACTLVLLFAPQSGTETGTEQTQEPAVAKRSGLTATVGMGLVAAMLSIFADWAIVRAIHGDRPDKHAGLNIRFGPRATITQPPNR